MIRDFVPVGLKGLLIAGLLAAFMSTFSGTINAAAAYLVNDVYKRYMRPNAPDRAIHSARVTWPRCSSLLPAVRPEFYMPIVDDGDRLDRVRLVGRLCRAEHSQMALVAAQRLGLFLGHDRRHLARRWRSRLRRKSTLDGEPSIWLISLFTDTQAVSFNGNLMAFPCCC